MLRYAESLIWHKSANPKIQVQKPQKLLPLLQDVTQVDDKKAAVLESAQ